MKYIDADKLKISLYDLAEHHKYYNGDFHDGVVFAVDEIIEDITSLQQEQPEVDLEKEIDEYFKDWVQDDADSVSNGGVITDKYQYATIFDCRRIARHFYELGRTRKEE